MTIKAITTIALSAIGSSIDPSLVSCDQALAKNPSNQSVMAAPTNSKSANQSAYGLLKYKNITATAGAASNRRAVNMFGIVHIFIFL
jgi:hypothetical protein